MQATSCVVVERASSSCIPFYLRFESTLTVIIATRFLDDTTDVALTDGHQWLSPAYEKGPSQGPGLSFPTGWTGS